MSLHQEPIVLGEVIDSVGDYRYSTDIVLLREEDFKSMYTKLCNEDLEAWYCYPFQFIPRKIL